MKDGIVIGIGEVLWDMLPAGKKLGGATANFAYHVSQFGVPSCVVSAVGDDALGQEIVENLASKGMNYLIDTVPYPTGTVQVEVDDNGVPQYEIRENVAWDNIPYTESLTQLANQAAAVCFGTLAQRNEISAETISLFLDAIPDGEDILKVFDVNLRQGFFNKEVLLRSMEKCNVLKINDEELVIISRMFNLPDVDMKRTCRKLVEEYGLKVLILTCGVNGSYVFTPDEESFLPTPKVKVADTVGAGDSFTAAFIACMLRGKSVTEAHAKAVQTSAYVCTQKGAMPILPLESIEWSEDFEHLGG